MTPQELKNSILQLAIQGKLVEQRPEEGTAGELYRQIQEEKQRLIKEGKIKKEKPLPEITEDEVPFEIPESWKWVRLGSIVKKISAGGDKPANFSKSKTEQYTVPVISNGEINKGIFGFTDKAEVMERSLTVSGRGTIGYTEIRTDPFVPIVRLLVIIPLKNTYLEYIKFAIQASTEYGIGSAVKQLTVPMLTPKLIPLPPIAEQKRIVAKIEELLPYIDRYEQAWGRLEAFTKRFPSDMQKSLLQLAIQGKLVEQRSEEGTAEELYQQIQAEKRRLVKEGKIKKEKPLPEIAEDDVPFEIPESWKWVRLGDCSSYAQRKEKVNATAIKEDEWSLDLEDIEKGTGRILQKCLASKRKIAGDKVRFYIGQILYSKLRPYLKKVLVAPDDGICSSEMVPFSVYGGINPQYIVYMLISPYADYVINSVTYGVKMPRVGTETMTNLLVPLPPLAEQKRIVAKLEELLPLCERLK